jgi:membrane-associated protein
MLQFLLDFVLHLDRHLVELLARYDLWIYALLAGVIFAETGFVVTPFLPGDSLLFAAGALAAVDASHTLRLPWLLPLLAAAAVLGNLANFAIGRAIGPRAWAIDNRWLRRRHLERTQAFFERYGALALVLSRFLPVVRTFMPFVAGVGRMHAGRFAAWTLVGGCAWVMLFLCGGYLFGNLPFVKANFGLVTLLIIVASLLPLLVVAWRGRRSGASHG